MRLRFNKCRLTVTGELAPPSTDPEAEAEALAGRVRALLDRLVHEGRSEATWMPADLSATLAAARRERSPFALVGLGTPRLAGMSIRPASRLARLRGVVAVLTLEPEAESCDPRLARALAARIAREVGVPLETLALADVATALWTAQAADSPGSYEIRARHRLEIAWTAVAPGVRIAPWQDRHALLELDASLAPGNEELFAALRSRMLETLVGLTSQNVVALIKLARREMAESSSWCVDSGPAQIVLLAPPDRPPRRLALRLAAVEGGLACAVTRARFLARPSREEVYAALQRTGLVSLLPTASDDLYQALEGGPPAVILDPPVVVSRGRAPIPPREPCFLRYGPPFAVPGDRIASTDFEQQGLPGVDPFGRPIVPRTTASDGLVAGDGVERIGDEFFALRSGMVRIEEQTIRVMPALVIEGALTRVDGHLHAEDAISVKGEVEHGASLSSAGSINLEQSFHCVYLRAGDGLAVAGGLCGDDRSIVHVRGALRVRFIQGGHVRCSGDVVIEGNMTGGILEARGSVTVLDPAGGIFGGVVRAGGDVTTPNAGREKGGAPSILFGTDVRAARRRATLGARAAKLRDALRRLERSGLAGDGRQSELPRRAAARLKARARQARLERLVRELDAKLALIDLRPRPDAKVTVAGRLEQGAKLCAAAHCVEVPRSMNGATVSIGVDDRVALEG